MINTTTPDERKQFATEEVLDSFYDREEKYTVELIHRIAGYLPSAPDFTRYAEDKWIVRFNNDQSVWYDTLADARKHFDQLRNSARV